MTLALQETITVQAEGARLEGDLVRPEPAHGLVLFAHGSGSSRFSPRNRLVADRLHDAHFATLLLDLLSLEEERIDEATGEFRFNIPLLAKRLVAAIELADFRPDTRALKIGLFGASTGAAAALIAAAERPGRVGAVVSRGGRPDLAAGALRRVKAPTLLIVGGDDHPDVLRWNRESLEQLTGPRELLMISGAGHLFEEPGRLEQVARAASDWFSEHLGPAPMPPL